MKNVGQAFLVNPGEQSLIFNENHVYSGTITFKSIKIGKGNGNIFPNFKRISKLQVYFQTTKIGKEKEKEGHGTFT